MKKYRIVKDNTIIIAPGPDHVYIIIDGVEYSLEDLLANGEAIEESV